jgi:PAS domain S-box-containing protein
MAAGGDPTAHAAFAHTQLVLDAVPRAIVVTDAEGLLIGWNTQAARLFGWTAAEVVGRPVREIVSPATPDAAAHDVLATIERGEVWRGDVSVVRRDGDVIRISTAVAPLRDALGVVVGAVGASDDVTELRLAQQQAADLNEHFRLALEAGRLGTWRWDRTTGEVLWDATMERLYGLEPGTFPGTYEAWIGLRGQDGGAGTAQATLEWAMATGEPYEIENRVVWPDGSVHWLQGRGKATMDERGAVTGAIGCTSDVTAHKVSELDARRRADELAETARRERLQHERLAFLAHLSDATLGAHDHRDLMAAVTRAAVPELGDWCTLHFVPEPGAVPDIAVAHADPERLAWLDQLRRRHPHDANGATGVAAVMRSGTTEFVPEVDETYVAAMLSTARVEPDAARAIIDQLRLTSIITVPLLTKRGTLGAMQFVSAESGRRYHDEDRRLAEAAAGRIAEALDNMWLVGQQRSIAATLQAALLPPSLPTVPGVDVAVRYWVAGAANEVGGDFYDLFALAGDRWAVVIGDVCGTGADGAAVTAIARHTIRAAARHDVGHTAILDWLNDAVLAGNRDRFCTVLYATLEPAPGRDRDLTVVSGGHPLPVIARADGSMVTAGVPGTLIGAFPSVRVTAQTTRLHPGDTVVLYTDGVTDLRPPAGLTTADVTRLVRRATGACTTADAIAEHLRGSIEAIRPIPERGDDIALVVLRVS